MLLMIVSGSCCYYFRLTDEGTKAQTGNLQKVTVVVNLQCKSGLSGSRFCALNHMPDSLS